MPEDAPRTPWQRVSAARRARRSEDTAARSDGGRRVPASGALRGNKGDVRTLDYVIEDKFTDADSFTIKRSMLRKTIQEALQMHGRLAMWRITIKGDRYRLMREEDYLFMKARADANTD